MMVMTHLSLLPFIKNHRMEDVGFDSLTRETRQLPIDSGTDSKSRQGLKSSVRSWGPDF
jgi:hypothetical protein